MSDQPQTPTSATSLADAPLRSELLSTDRLAEEARTIAAEQVWVADKRLRSTPLIGLMRRAATDLAADNRVLAHAARATGGSAPAGEWLLDNYYLIEEQVLIVKADLPENYGVELPRLASGEYRDFPRLYTALLTLIAHTDGRLDQDNLERFIAGFQEVTPLTIGEVWAVPIMLRIGLVENLRRLSHAAIASLRAEVAADWWAGRLVNSARDEAYALPEVLSELDAETSKSPLPATFYVRLSRRLGELERGGEAINAWLENRLSAGGIVLETAAVDAQQEQAADQVSIANSITSIRLLDALDWREFFETVSVAEDVLRGDPMQTYAVMDFGSRDRYRHALELIARHSPASEIDVAEKVVALSREAMSHDASDQVRGHVGWWLIGAGRLELEPAIGYRPRVRERIYRGPLLGNKAAL
jgi:cyclic beta-1,2-glucan synthetase